MRKLLPFIISLSAILLVLPLHASDSQSFNKWQQDKFSMFIHFGLYSHLGGVWEGEPVKRGYSEQIQSFAGIFGDWYASVAEEFNPVDFDARAIVSLAKQAGMRSIVFTSKHHDGFCMFDTVTTDYDSVEATPSGRDYVKEIADACAEAGIRFGLYFSLIDWHYPHAYPISSHNADFITPQHHELNKAQVSELLTSYGPVSELWFDMGSLTPDQSAELYDLVKELQPDCLVSGRLGNDRYDFAVMADNRLPDSQLHAPWQSAASMFPETWSWRSWQERGEVKDKVAQKIRSLVDVVSRGGNYLLNIGPQADGSVVQFEAEVLKKMGEWLKINGDAVYSASPSPFREIYDWGCVTVNGRMMYLILCGKCPDDKKITLSIPGYLLQKCIDSGVLCSMGKGVLNVTVSEELYADYDNPKVVRLMFDKDIVAFNAVKSVDVSHMLGWDNATPDYSYSCFDYYSNYRSIVGYNWVISGRKKVSEIDVYYTDQEIGRNVVLQVGNEAVELSLDGKDHDMPALTSIVENQSVSRLRWGVFDGPSSWQGFDWQGLKKEEQVSDVFYTGAFSNYLLLSDVDMPEAGYSMFEVTSGNGVELIVNGVSMMKHLNPYRSTRYSEKVLLSLPKGKSTIAVRSYNRFEKMNTVKFAAEQAGVIYRKTVRLPALVSSSGLQVRIYASDCDSVHKDCCLHNLRLGLK